MCACLRICLCLCALFVCSSGCRRIGRTSRRTGSTTSATTRERTVRTRTRTRAAHIPSVRVLFDTIVSGYKYSYGLIVLLMLAIDLKIRLDPQFVLLLLRRAEAGRQSGRRALRLGTGYVVRRFNCSAARTRREMNAARVLLTLSHFHEALLCCTRRRCRKLCV